VFLVDHLFDIGAGGERLVRSGDQDATDADVGLEFLANIAAMRL
jgi:hypothetical protein